METQTLEHGVSIGRKSAGMTDRDCSAERYELRELDDAEKQDQRDKVKFHIAARHSQQEHLRLLSLPDQLWTFERQLDFEHPRCTFVGLQWSWMHAEKGAPWMPGAGRPEKFTETIGIGDIAGFRRDRSAILYCHAGHFNSVTNKEIGGSSRQKTWRKTYRGRTAVWLDFQSQLCLEVERCATGLPRQLDPFKKSIPAAFSFLAARDSFSDDESRVAQLVQWIGQPSYRLFAITDVWRHQSAGTPFLTVAGVFHKRHKRLQRKPSTTAAQT